MLITGTYADALSRRVDHQKPAGIIWSGDMFAGDPLAPLSPHAFYVHHDPGVIGERHFHFNAEFQVVVDGGGRIGPHGVQPLTVHYAAHETVYGPLVPGPQGLGYVTLRPVTERGATWWPEQRDLMHRNVYRWQLSAHAHRAAAAELAALAAPQLEIAMPPAPSGLAAWIARLPPGARLDAPRHPGGAGRFHLVTAGALVLAGGALAGLAAAWSDPGEEPDLQAGPDGAEIVVMQFPTDALTRYA